MGSEYGITGATKPTLRLDAVGIWWISLAAVWTVLVCAGMGFLLAYRHLPLLKIRGLGLSLAAITFMHIFWVSVQFGYPLGALAPSLYEYYVMGIYLPCGMAFFQASNSRFLHVAKRQRRFAVEDESKLSQKNKPKTLVDFFRNLDYSTKMIIVASLSSVVQIFLTVLMYLISRKWHSSYGIPGTEVHGTPQEQNAEQGSGWEWWPGIAGQLVWSWIVAPYILWKARDIHDTQGWRTQTIGCCVANLHAAPMWLIGVYVPGMQPVNTYFVPPQWIAISVMITEIFTIFVPCWEVYRLRNLRQETLNTIAEWERKKTKKTGSGGESLRSGESIADSILSMRALEHALETNSDALQSFSALRDFSGENIAFLTSIAKWKESCEQPSDNGNPEEVLRDRFNRALRIYVDYVSTRDAEFPVNISSQHLKELEVIFEGAARVILGERDNLESPTPFDFGAPRSSGDSDKGIMTVTDNAYIVDRVFYWGHIPEEFNDKVFDDAEQSIKYLVLTNTWPKFVKDRRYSADSLESLEPGFPMEKVLKAKRKWFV